MTWFTGHDINQMFHMYDTMKYIIGASMKQILLVMLCVNEDELFVLITPDVYSD